jgi:hypothetical protein
MNVHVATEKSFVPSLRWLLAAPEARSASVISLARFLAAFWSAVEKTAPEAFAEPSRYLLQRTPGFMSLHRIAPIVYREVHHLAPTAARRKLDRLLGPLASRGSKFWKKSNKQGARRFGTGQLGYANLFEALLEDLDLMP